MEFNFEHLQEPIKPITKEELRLFLLDHTKVLAPDRYIDLEYHVIDVDFVVDRLYETIDIRYNQLLLKEAFEAGYTSAVMRKYDDKHRRESYGNYKQELMGRLQKYAWVVRSDDERASI